MTDENIFNKFCTKIWENVDIRTGLGLSSDIIGKSIAASRGVEAFELVYPNSPKKLRALDFFLKLCAFEASWAALVTVFE